mmetsp:Transcript_51084/g.119587  ORF Transcript_51084/g.119587 Transcript_51084/m.119587 type:complete len:495 (+) Transcript_51084:82-1566(+)
MKPSLERVDHLREAYSTLSSSVENPHTLRYLWLFQCFEGWHCCFPSQALPRRRRASKLGKTDPPESCNSVREHLSQLRNEVHEQLWCNWEADGAAVYVEASTLGGTVCSFRVGAGATGVEVKERAARMLGLTAREIDLVFASGPVADDELILQTRQEELAGPVPQMTVLRKPVREVLVGSECTLKLWDIVEGSCLHTLRGHGDGVLSLSVDWPARYALSGAHDCTLRLWDLDHNICVKTINCPEHPAFCVAFDAESQQVLTGSWDSNVKLWDLSTLRCIRTLQGHARCVKCLAVNWYLNRAISGSYDADLILWDLGTGEKLAVLSGHTDRVLALDACWTAGRVASGSEDHTVRLWDFADAGCRATLRGHRAPVSCVAMSWATNRLVTGCWAGTLRLWDIGPLKADQSSQAMCLCVLDEMRALTCVAVDWQVRQALAASGHRIWCVDIQDEALECLHEVDWTRIEMQQPGAYGELSIGMPGTLTCLSLRPTYTGL